MKTLIIITHPDIGNSVVNKRWMEELKKYPDQFTLHHLDAIYPDGIIDVAAEQALVEKYERIIFQFPYYWFYAPPLLKKWFDEVLLHGWAYGSKSGYKLQGKKIALAMSIGVDEEEYAPGARYRYDIKTLTAPFELTFEYVKADYRPLFAFYGLEYHLTNERLEQSVTDYLDYLRKF
jgi:putative NADPH-quinone reductase